MRVDGLDHILQLLYRVFSEQSHSIAWTIVASNALKQPQTASPCYATSAVNCERMSTLYDYDTVWNAQHKYGMLNKSMAHRLLA